MKKLYFLVALLILSGVLYCQTTPDWLWAKQAGGINNDICYCITTDNSGNSYVAGSFMGTVTFGDITLTSSGCNDVFITKLDENGNWLWTKQAGGIYDDLGLGIATDSSGNCYVTGCFGATITCGTTSLTSSGNFDVLIVKLDTNGNWLWAKQAGGANDDRGFSIAIDSSGNSYITGYFYDTATFGTTTLSSSGYEDIFIAKLDTNGNWMWAKQAGGSSSEESYGIAIDSSGNSYVAGYFFGTTSLGTITLISNGLSDIFIAKLDANGNWLWAKKAGGASDDWGYCIATDSGGNCYVTGSFHSDASFGTIPLYSGINDGIFVTKLDELGNWLWAKKASGTGDVIGTGIATDISGCCYVTGPFLSAATFGTTTLSTNMSSPDIFISKLDINGYWLWAKQAGGSSSEESYGIAIDNSGNSYVTGYFYDTATFGTTTLTSSGSEDIFIAKLSSDGVFVTDELSPPATSSSHLGNAYPNPFHRDSNCLIKAEIPLQETGVFTIYNLRGQVVQSQQLSSGSHDISFTGKDLAPGIYFYRLKTPTQCEVKKLILLR